MYKNIKTINDRKTFSTTLILDTNCQLETRDAKTDCQKEAIGSSTVPNATGTSWKDWNFPVDYPKFIVWESHFIFSNPLCAKECPWQKLLSVMCEGLLWGTLFGHLFTQYGPLILFFCTLRRGKQSNYFHMKHFGCDCAFMPLIQRGFIKPSFTRGNPSYYLQSCDMPMFSNWTLSFGLEDKEVFLQIE